MKTVKEKSRFTVTVKLRNGTTPTAPDTLAYRVDCRTTKRQILDWTPVTPASSVSVTALPSWNTILDTSNLMEQKSITFSANRGTDDELNDVYTWEVKNLQGVM
jgi:hypothetical protein